MKIIHMPSFSVTHPISISILIQCYLEINVTFNVHSYTLVLLPNKLIIAIVYIFCTIIIFIGCACLAANK